jgi:4-amino-4-deoxy-L-arabinose transferase-like glycosyltransferase
MKLNLSVFILILAYLVLATAYNVVVGVGEVPDELPHMEHVRHIITYHALPLQMPDPSHHVGNQAHQPPAYYALGALLTGWIAPGNYQLVLNPAFDIVPNRLGGRQRFYHTQAEAFPYRGLVLAYHVLRAFSTALGAITIWAIFRAAQVIAPQRPTIAVLAAGLAAFNPQFIFLTASVNNDNLGMAAASLMLLTGLMAWQQPSLRLTAVMGFLIGLAALSKYNALAVAPGAVLALMAPYLRRRRWREVAGHIALVIGLAAIISGWWFLQNWQLYGDPLAQQIAYHSLSGVRRYSPWRWSELPGNIVSAFTSSWGRFGWMNITLYPAIYVALAVLCLAALIGMIGAAWRLMRAGRRREWRLIPHVSLALAALGIMAFVARYHLFVPADHGRLFFPGLLAFAIFLALGLAELAGRWQTTLALSVIASLLALSMGSVAFVLRPAYALPHMLSEAELRASHPLAAQFGDGIALRGFDISPRALRPNQSFDLTLYWQALRPIDTNYWLLIQLLDPTGRPLAHSTTLPYTGRYATVLWQPGDLFADHYRLTVVPDARPGAAELVVLFDSYQTTVQEQWAQDGQTVGNVLTLTTLKIEPTAQPAYHPTRSLSVRFGEEVRLTGYDLPASSVHAGQPMTLTLYWQAIKPTRNDYHVFVHLICADRLAAQDDGVPGQGWFPSVIWTAGDVIRDEHKLELPPDIPAGACAISTGLYNFESGERLLAADASGQRLAEDRAVLAQLDILP